VSNPNFFVGSGIDSSWGKRVPDLELKEMEELAGLGTQYFLTTPIFELDSFHEFMKRWDRSKYRSFGNHFGQISRDGSFLNKHVKPGMVPTYH